MLATRAFTHIASGEDLEAANWAERAARSPGAHVLIAMIAVVAHALSGNEARAKAWSADVRTRNATLTQREFFQAFPMKAQSTVTRVSKALGKFGF
jgi:glyoxylate carboligase